ncbi:hypothetical protein D3C87_1829610 [compost metagenome]
MGNFRVKEIKFGRPVATKDRLPNETELSNGWVLAWSHKRHVWERHSLALIAAMPKAFPFWRRIFS